MATRPIQLIGHEEVKAKIRKRSHDINGYLAAALFIEGNKIMRASQMECPVDTGTLRRSAYVAPPTGQRNPIVELGYGTNYALAVHEINKKYRVGKWRFLRDPFNAMSRGFEDRLARTVRRNIASGRAIAPMSKEYPSRPRSGSGKSSVK